MTSRAMPVSRTLSRPSAASAATHSAASRTLMRAMSAIGRPWKRTACACGFRRAPAHSGQGSSTRPSTSGSSDGKLCSRPRASSSRTESSSARRCSRVSFRPVPTQPGHQPCLLL